MDNSGYALVEADDPALVASFVSKFFYWNDVEVKPVLDIEQMVSIGSVSMTWAQENAAP
jgi:hypothetical protein